MGKQRLCVLIVYFSLNCISLFFYHCVYVLMY